jgi:hypothetical protein
MNDPEIPEWTPRDQEIAKTVGLLTDAARGLSEALGDIASAIQQVADAIREGQPDYEAPFHSVREGKR